MSGSGCSPGGRTAVERHQTLRAAVDWSYGLLSEPERTVFDRLAVFSGGFTLAAATAVVTGDGMESWDIVDAVAGLAAKSMVVAEPGAGEHTRYQLLETLRQYGRERLDQGGATDRWRQRHARHFAAFAAEVGRGLRGRDELAWRQRLLGDLDNFRSAVVWGLDSGVEDDQQTAVATVAWLAYEAQAKATGIGRWAEQTLPAAQGPGCRSAVHDRNRRIEGFRIAPIGARARSPAYEELEQIEIDPRVGPTASQLGSAPRTVMHRLGEFGLDLLVLLQIGLAGQVLVIVLGEVRLVDGLVVHDPSLQFALIGDAVHLGPSLLMVGDRRIGVVLHQGSHRMHVVLVLLLQRRSALRDLLRNGQAVGGILLCLLGRRDRVRFALNGGP